MNKAFDCICLVASLCVCLPSCRQPLTQAGVEAAMQHYNRLLKKTDADSIAALFTVDGSLGDVRGRDSIRRFLEKFKEMKVLAQHSTTSFISLGSDTAMQKGTYHQTVVLPKGDTINVQGTFTANWLYISDNWLLKKMQTGPAN